MAQVDVALNGRTYVINCADGQEKHVARLGSYIARKVGEVVKSPDQPVDVRILLMASLMIADELAEAESRLEAKAAVPVTAAVAAPVEPAVDPALAARVESLAGRVQAIAAQLEEDYL